MNIDEQARDNLKDMAHVEANISQEMKILQLEQQLAEMKAKFNELIQKVNNHDKIYHTNK